MFVFCFKKGFTLSEILMVLVIIGLIASMTIPSLVRNSNELEAKSRWKKIYSTFSQVARLIELEDGPLTSVCYNATGENMSTFKIDECIRDKFLAKIKYIKKCDQGKTYGQCFHNVSAMKYVSCANGGKYNIQYWSDDAGAILSDGAYVVFWTWGVTETTADWGNRFVFDVNGAKGPNTIGKDIFMLKMVNGQLRPAPIYDFIPLSSQYSGTTAQNCGWDNSTKFLYEN